MDSVTILPTHFIPYGQPPQHHHQHNDFQHLAAILGGQGKKLSYVYLEILKKSSAHDLFKLAAAESCAAAQKIHEITM